MFMTQHDKHYENTIIMNLHWLWMHEENLLNLEAEVPTNGPKMGPKKQRKPQQEV
jgi:hypothetical protein